MHSYLRSPSCFGQSSTVSHLTNAAVMEKENKIMILKLNKKLVCKLKTKEENLKRMQKYLTINILCKKK